LGVWTLTRINIRLSERASSILRGPPRGAAGLTLVNERPRSSCEFLPKYRRGEIKMPIWRLVPTDLADPVWGGSSHRAAAVVRAPSEAAARRVAGLAFEVKTAVAATEDGILPPWKNSDVVRAEMIEDARYDPRGASEVLDPAL
jgi:hypothetical protein